MPARADLGWSPHGPVWDKLLVVAMLLAAAGCSGAPHSASSPPSTQPPSTPTATTLPAFDRSRFAAILPVSVSGAGNLAVADGRLWVLTGAGTVVRLDPATNRVVGKPLRVPADTAAIAVAQGALWVTTVASGDLGAPGKDTAARIDLATGRTVATITVRRAPLDVAVTLGTVWVPNAGGGGDSVARIDPQANRLVGRPVRTGASPQSLAVGGGSLWVANHDACTVARIDQAGVKVVADIPVPSEPHRVVGAPIPIGSQDAGNLVVGAGGVWVTSDYRVDGAAEDVVVVRIDPQSNRAVETVAVGGRPIDVAATGGAVWVSVADPGTVLRIAGR
jgi:DNA-binding beta-propeller fold protein YncE